MASTVMHICIAKKVNETLHLPEEEFFLGAIAPDISKQVGESRDVSHFTTQTEYPDLNTFLDKYKSEIHQTFTLGYFLHLYSDYIWFKYYLDYISRNSKVHLKTGEEVNLSEEEFTKLIYNDYTNLNTVLIDEYKLDLSLFFEETKIPVTKIEEIPIQKLQILVDKMGLILLESKKEKSYLFDLKDVNTYIEATAKGFLDWYQKK